MFHKNATLFGKVVTSCRKRRTKGRQSGGSEQRQGAEMQKYGCLKKGNFLIVHARAPRPYMISNYFLYSHSNPLDGADWCRL